LDAISENKMSLQAERKSVVLLQNLSGSYLGQDEDEEESDQDANVK